MRCIKDGVDTVAAEDGGKKFVIEIFSKMIAVFYENAYNIAIVSCDSYFCLKG